MSFSSTFAFSRELPADLFLLLFLFLEETEELEESERTPIDPFGPLDEPSLRMDLGYLGFFSKDTL
jgi:hypothetical protein